MTCKFGGSNPILYRTFHVVRTNTAHHLIGTAISLLLTTPTQAKATRQKCALLRKETKLTPCKIDIANLIKFIKNISIYIFNQIYY